MNIAKRITNHLNLTLKQVEATINLIDEGSTIPFIARYRKEVTDHLSDGQLRELFDQLTYLRSLEERMKTVLSTIDEQGKLTPELAAQIDQVETLAQLEDLYRPYKPKRRTRATIAKEKGLEPLADYIKRGIKEADYSTYIEQFVNQEKAVHSLEEALKGACDIIAEEMSDQEVYRTFIKRLIHNEGLIESKEISKDDKDTYGQYASYHEKIASIPPHRILAINRGEKVKCLKVGLTYDVDEIEKRIARDYMQDNAFGELLETTIKDALKRLILPSVENEIRSDLMTRAEDSSIEVFKKNLKALLLYPPLKNQTILGFDPGFRTGCKYALVNPHGIPSRVGVVFLTAASESQKERARQEIVELLSTHQIDYIALGNGTASRESEEELSNIIKTHGFKTKLFIVNESGASVYSASKLAELEFPDLSVEKRSAISLARRMQDPLSELVKIDPKAIGVGQYQHDMNQTKLSNSLHGVVEDVVNTVGVNLNNASVALLSYVAGISQTVAVNIYEHLKQEGSFKTRNDLKKVAKLGAKTFEQCAGFLRIYGGKEALDATAIHPESYPIAKAIMKETGLKLDDEETVKSSTLSRLNLNDLSKRYQVGQATLKDIIDEIVRPGRDIREAVALVELNPNVRDIKDLKVGMVLNGTVRNIMDFGMFVDINVHQDGLVHISEVAHRFVKDISAIYTVNDIVKVKVISLDLDKKRIGLSIKQVG